MGVCYTEPGGSKGIVRAAPKCSPRKCRVETFLSAHDSHPGPTIYFPRGRPVSYVDKSLACRDCGAPFSFTAGEQEFYAQKGFTNEPSRCPECRSARKAAGGSSSGGSFGAGGYDSGVGYGSG